MYTAAGTWIRTNWCYLSSGQYLTKPRALTPNAKRHAQLEKAVDLSQEAQALFTNFDASVYTIIFIPSDEVGVLPPGAERYLKQVSTHSEGPWQEIRTAPLFARRFGWAVGQFHAFFARTVNIDREGSLASSAAPC